MLKDLSDEALMQAYLSGDSSAFELIYARYSKKILGYLRKKLVAPEEQDEVFQLVFLKFHKSRKSYDPKYPLLQWLYVLTRSVYLDHLKQVRRIERVTDLLKTETEINELSQNGDSASLNESETQARLSSLSGVQKEVVTQRVLDETSYEEIASRLDLSESNVRQVFSRAMRKLRSVEKLSSGGSK